MRQANAQVLLPGFDTDNLKFQSGVSDPRIMAAKVDDGVQMRKILGSIIQAFHLDPLDANIQKAYDTYLQEIKKLMEKAPVQSAVELAKNERKLENNPQDPFLYHDRGRLLYDLSEQNYPEAVQNLLYAIYLNPHYSEAYYSLIKVAGTHHDFLRSLAVAEESCAAFHKTHLPIVATLMR